MATREEEFDEVRRQLDGPMANRPSSLVIVSELIRTEQSMMNRLSREGSKGWATKQSTITTIDGTADYLIEPADGSKVGRILYAFRGDEQVQVPIVDLGHGIASPSLEFFTTAGIANDELTGSKIATWRDGADCYAKICPTPTTDDVVITIVYAVGELDASTFEWGQTPALPEWSFLRVANTARRLVERSGWAGLGPAETQAKKAAIKNDLMMQIAEEMPNFEAFVRNPTPESISEIDDWYN